MNRCHEATLQLSKTAEDKVQSLYLIAMEAQLRTPLLGVADKPETHFLPFQLTAMVMKVACAGGQLLTVTIPCKLVESGCTVQDTHSSSSS